MTFGLTKILINLITKNCYKIIQAKKFKKCPLKNLVTNLPWQQILFYIMKSYIDHFAVEF